MNRRVFLRCVAKLQAHRCAVTLRAEMAALKGSRTVYVNPSHSYDGPAPLPLAARRKKRPLSV